MKTSEQLLPKLLLKLLLERFVAYAQHALLAVYAASLIRVKMYSCEISCALWGHSCSMVVFDVRVK
jgi:hypothetical protein